MAQHQASGKPWSGSNPIPNIQKFVENLDKNKKDRDRQLDEQSKQSKKPTSQSLQDIANRDGGKAVTDPTTGKEVVIEDAGKDFMKTVKDPQVWHSSTAVGLTG